MAIFGLSEFTSKFLLISNKKKKFKKRLDCVHDVKHTHTHTQKKKKKSKFTSKFQPQSIQTIIVSKYVHGQISVCDMHDIVEGFSH